MTNPGRPSEYRPAYAELAHNYCLLGATNEELGGFFEVTSRTIDNWISTIPDFEASVRAGRDVADSVVARRLYERAIGYSYEATKVMVWRGEVVTHDYTVKVPPDTQAAIFWLRNRRRRSWRESPSVEAATAATEAMLAMLEAAGEKERHAEAT